MKERFRVLKVISEATRSLNLNEFAQMVGSTSSQTMKRIQELLKAWFLRKIGGGYGIADVGKVVLKAFSPVSTDMEFRFYVALGQPTSFSARSLIDFYEVVKQVDVGSLEFHLHRGDFENWVRIPLNDAELTEAFADLRIAGIAGENLRLEIVKAIEARCGFKKIG